MLTYDGFDRKIASIDPSGSRKTVQYDSAGKPVTEEIYGKATANGTPDALLSSKNFTYDEAGRPIKLDEAVIIGGVNSGQRSYQYKYDLTGNLIRQIDPLGNISISAYDAVGRMTSYYDPVGNQKIYSYDKNGNILSENRREYHDSEGLIDNVTSYQYDSLNRMTAKIDNMGHTWSYAYDSMDKLRYTSDPLDVAGIDVGANAGSGNVERFEYDGLGRIIKKIEEMKSGGVGSGSLIDTIVTTFMWDDNSRLASVVDAAGNATGYSYDSLDRRIRTTLPDDSVYAIAYDKESRVSTFSMPNDYLVRFTYDAAGNTQGREISASGIAKGRDVFAYDGMNRMLSAVSYDNNNLLIHSASYDYDSSNNVVAATQQGNAVVSTYNSLGYRTSLSYPGGMFEALATDAAGRVKNIGETVLGNIATFAYAGGKRRAGAVYGNGTQGAFAYDAVSRLSRSRWKDSGGVDIANHILSYDKRGNLLLDELLNNGTKGDVYNYDSIYKLTRTFKGVTDAKANYGDPASAASEQRYDYSYDKMYNFTSDKKVETSPVLSVERAYTVNNLNQYVSISSVVNGAASETEYPVYDKNGNIIQDAKYIYAYNWRNQITEVNNVSDGSLVARYNYDALGRRISKFDAAIGEVTNYIYDGWQVIEERDAVNQVKASYIYSGLDEPVAMLKEGTVYYYHYNRLGSIEAVTDAGGNLVEKYSYDPFGGFKIYNVGGAELSESQIGNRYYFTGREYDAETGLYNYRNRYYSPEMGRFMSRDPLGYADSLNAYAYVLSDPVNWIDPFGLAKVSQNSYVGQVTGYPMYGPANFQTGNVWIDPSIGLVNDAINVVDNVFYDTFAAIGGTIALIEDVTGVSFNELYVASLSAPTPFEIDTVASYGFSRLSEIGHNAIERSGYLGRILASERGGINADNISSVTTRWGVAKQSNSFAALSARVKVVEGATLYRIGTLGRSNNTVRAQFWSLEHPLNQGYASRYGVPMENIVNANFIESAVIKPDTQFITRIAPPIGTNLGGGIEVVVPEGGIVSRSFNVFK